MTEKNNPDLFRPIDVPENLKPYVRRALVADCRENVDMVIDVRATGYHYLGWTWRGGWQGHVNGDTLFDSAIDGPLHMTGQIAKADVAVKIQHDVGQVFLEFTALGHFQLLGITGVQLLMQARAPHVLNPALGPYFDTLLDADATSTKDRITLLFNVLTQLPKHTIPAGIVSAVDRIEAADGAIKISDLLMELGLAERQFRSDFKSLTGLTPKAFCKTLQINQALNQLLKNKGGDLAGIAAQAGFADQAHFTRAFGDFLGGTPGNYLADIEITFVRFVGQSRQL